MNTDNILIGSRSRYWSDISLTYSEYVMLIETFIAQWSRCLELKVKTSPSKMFGRKRWGEMVGGRGEGVVSTATIPGLVRPYLPLFTVL